MMVVVVVVVAAAAVVVAAAVAVVLVMMTMLMLMAVVAAAVAAAVVVAVAVEVAGSVAVAVVAVVVVVGTMTMLKMVTIIIAINTVGDHSSIRVSGAQASLQLRSRMKLKSCQAVHAHQGVRIAQCCYYWSSTLEKWKYKEGYRTLSSLVYTQTRAFLGLC